MVVLFLLLGHCMGQTGVALHTFMIWLNVLAGLTVFACRCLFAGFSLHHLLIVLLPAAIGLWVGDRSVYQDLSVEATMRVVLDSVTNPGFNDLILLHASSPNSEARKGRLF